MKSTLSTIIALLFAIMSAFVLYMFAAMVYSLFGDNISFKEALTSEIVIYPMIAFGWMFPTFVFMEVSEIVMHYFKRTLIIILLLSAPAAFSQTYEPGVQLNKRKWEVITTYKYYKEYFLEENRGSTLTFYNWKYDFRAFYRFDKPTRYGICTESALIIDDKRAFELIRSHKDDWIEISPYKWIYLARPENIYVDFSYIEKNLVKFTYYYLQE